MLRSSVRKRHPTIPYDDRFPIHRDARVFTPHRAPLSRAAKRPPLQELPQALNRSTENPLVSVDRQDPEQPFSPIPIEIPISGVQRTLPKFVPMQQNIEKGRVLVQGLSTAFQHFQLFITPLVISIMVCSTNGYAAAVRNETEELPFTRDWREVDEAEMYRYLGCRLYMGLDPRKRRESYWEKETGYLRKFISLVRFEQIHRYFHLRDCHADPIRPEEPWWVKLEPVASLIREAFKKAYLPSSEVTVDEAMEKFEGRNAHTVKMKNKPIPEGFKLWVLADAGYVWSWLFHSKLEGPEGSETKLKKVKILEKPKQRRSSEKGDDDAGRNRTKPKRANPSPFFSDTKAVVLRLAKQLPQGRDFRLYLDNLFTDVELALSLKELGVSMMGTTRKDAAGFPEWLIRWKDLKEALVWDSMQAEIVEDVLCVVWQDNSAVLLATTAFGADEKTEKDRRRPTATSTNAAHTRPVFGDSWHKLLWIPLAIDRYNYCMNGVDIADQLRKEFQIHRDYERKSWRPLFDWLFDTSCNNAYFLWLKTRQLKTTNDHQIYTKELIDALLNFRAPESPTPPPMRELGVSKHRLYKVSKRGHCQWCRTHLKDWFPLQAATTGTGSPFGGVVSQDRKSASSNPRRRGSKVQWKCKSCDVYLCKRSTCFKRFHGL